MKILRFLLVMLPIYSFGQPHIEYGSNNGDYQEVFESCLYYESYGQGTPLLLLHGGMGSISNFSSVINGLSKHYKVIAVDSPGHGRSKSIDSLSYPIMAKFLSEFVNQLDLDSLYIAGFSDGAISALWMARNNPDKVKKVIFGAGALGPGFSKPQGLAMLQSVSPETMPESLAEAYRRKSPQPEQWETFVQASKNMWLDPVWYPEEGLADLRAKILVLFGDNDPFIPLNHSLEIYSGLPSSSLCILPNTGHSVFENSDLVLPVLLNFLGSL